MALIKARTEKVIQKKFRCKLWAENQDTLYCEAERLGEDVEYIVNALLEALSNDKDHKQYREAELKKNEHKIFTPKHDEAVKPARKVRVSRPAA